MEQTNERANEWQPEEKRYKLSHFHILNTQRMFVDLGIRLEFCIVQNTANIS